MCSPSSSQPLLFVGGPTATPILRCFLPSMFLDHESAAPTDTYLLLPVASAAGRHGLRLNPYLHRCATVQLSEAKFTTYRNTYASFLSQTHIFSPIATPLNLRLHFQPACFTRTHPEAPFFWRYVSKRRLVRLATYSRMFFHLYGKRTTERNGIGQENRPRKPV